MANPNIQTNYSGEVLEEFLTLATTGNELVERGLIHIEQGVQYKKHVPRLTASKMLQQYKKMPKAGQASEGGDSKGGMNITEKTLEPTKFMAYTEFDPTTLEHIWRKWQPKGPLVFTELPPEVQTQFIKEFLKQVKKETGWHLINGVKGTTDDLLFNGIVYRIKEDPDTIKAGSSAVSMVGKLYALRSQIPAPVLADPGCRILMSQADFFRYDRELTEQTAKGVNHTDISPRQFKGIKIEDLVNWPSGYIVATITGMGTDSNLYAATSLADDVETVNIDKVSNAGDLYFFRLVCKLDTNIAFGQECTVLEKVTPKIEADKTALTFPVTGGEENVKLTVTEEYIVEYIPDGFVVTEDENGILVSADDNTGAADIIADEIRLALKEHRSRKLRISVSQPNA